MLLEGTVFAGENDVRSYNLVSLRDAVFAFFVCSAVNVRDNPALGDPNATTRNCFTAFYCMLMSSDRTGDPAGGVNVSQARSSASYCGVRF